MFRCEISERRDDEIGCREGKFFGIAIVHRDFMPLLDNRKGEYLVALLVLSLYSLVEDYRTEC